MDTSRAKFDENDPRTIRKLGFFESLEDEELMHHNMTITTTTIFSVEKGANVDMVSLKKALVIWIKSHSLLQAGTHRVLDRKTQRPRIDLPKYFVKIEKNIEDYNNLEFIENNSDNSLNWMSLAESELKTPLDYQNGPLWRMKIFKINENTSEHNLQYALLLTISHSISDGRNSFSIIAQFLNILDNVMQDQSFNQVMEVPSASSWENILENLKATKKLRVSRDEFNFLNNFRHRIPNNVGKNNLNGANMRINKIIIAEEKLSKMVKTMKSNEPTAKLTSLLTVIICLAFRHACIVHKASGIPLDSFVVSVPVCIRKKLDVDNLQMGSYVGSIKSVINLSGRKSSKSLIKNRFWSVANRISYYFLIYLLFPLYFLFIRYFKKGKFCFPTIKKHNQEYYLKNAEKTSTLADVNEDFWSIVADNSTRLHKSISDNLELEITEKKLFEILSKNDFDFSTFYPVNFNVSNLGAMANTNSESTIKISESYLCVSFKEKRFGGYLYFGLTTIEKNLYCAISYNEKFFSEKFVNDVRINILKIIDMIFV